MIEYNDDEINSLVDPEWGPGVRGDVPLKDDEVAHVNAPPRKENSAPIPAMLLKGEPGSEVAKPEEDGLYVGHCSYVLFPEQLYGPFTWNGDQWSPLYVPRVKMSLGRPSRPRLPQRSAVYLDSDARSVLHAMAEEVRALNQEKGWYDQPRSFGDEMMNLAAEVAEAWEAYRKREFEQWESEGGKPEGVGSELADVFIRLLDDCASHDIDLFWEYRQKMDFNWTRPYRHGGKLR